VVHSWRCTAVLPCNTCLLSLLHVYAQCTFTSNLSGENGGAVAMEVSSVVEADDCVFTGNRVTVERASTDTGDGGTAIYRYIIVQLQILLIRNYV
jgi:predicted outer membrane repeat protein